MDIGKVLRQSWNVCRGQLQHHTALWAIVAPITAVGKSLLISVRVVKTLVGDGARVIIFYCSLRNKGQFF